MVERTQPEDAGAAPADQPLAVASEVNVADVTQPDPQETVRVKLVSGVVDAPKPTPSRDGTVPGVPIYSSEHCPLLVGEADIVNTTVVEQHVGQDGEPAGRTVHRYPEHLLTNPVKCPSCGTWRERHGLILNTETSERDCAIAIQRARNPKYTAQFGADAAARAQANADSKDAATGPAAAGNDDYAGRVKPLDTRELASENETDEARAAREGRYTAPQPGDTYQVGVDPATAADNADAGVERSAIETNSGLNAQNAPNGPDEAKADLTGGA
jgi:hypothetical protein